MNKRQFLKNLSTISLAAAPFYSQLNKLVESVSNQSPEELARNGQFWNKIRADYRLKEEYINLENGYYCFTPQPTLERYIDHIREVNLQGSYYMRTKQWENKDRMAASLAEIAGCDPDELVITRNTTESLDTIISGYDWKMGDEAVMAEQDYGAMLNQFNLMSRRYGMINKMVSVPNHPKSDSEIVELYANAITEKTKLLMICHMINITGQILPVRKICDMAHERGVDVMVDGAHAFAHINYSLHDLNCDYYGTSLHKWMSVPLGAGFLYVKREKVKNLWPVFEAWGKPDDHISKLNHTGTHPVSTDLAVQNAIEYYQLIGGERKEARLRFLQNYWTDQVRDISGITVNTPLQRNRSCGIANVGIDKMTPKEMSETLLEKYKVWTVAIDSAGVKGCRITPNVYTTLDELDAFVDALKKMA